MTSRSLGSALAEALVRTGARAVRLLDVRTGTVLGSAGATAEDDVPALVRLAVQAASAAAVDGGLDDLVLTTDRSAHVLRTTARPGIFLHVRLPAGRPDLAAVRRALASVPLPEDIRASAPEPADAGELPAQPPHGQPALAALGPSAGRSGGPSPHPGWQPSPRPRTAERALRALGPVGVLPRRIPVQAGLQRQPRRVADAAATPSELPQAWATDVPTLHRLLTALRRPEQRG